jgi:putative flippase GtrA
MGNSPDRLTAMRDGHGLKFLRFVAVGVLNTGVGYGIYLVGLLVGLSPAMALAVAYALGATFNYFSTGRLVFRAGGVALLPRFLLAYAAVYVFNLALLKAALRLGAAPWMGQAIVMPVAVVVSYLVLNYAVFHPRAEGAAARKSGSRGAANRFSVRPRDQT